MPAKPTTSTKTPPSTPPKDSDTPKKNKPIVSDISFDKFAKKQDTENNSPLKTSTDSLLRSVSALDSISPPSRKSHSKKRHRTNSKAQPPEQTAQPPEISTDPVTPEVTQPAERRTLQRRNWSEKKVS
jgi:hypothetical protein